MVIIIRVPRLIESGYLGRPLFSILFILWLRGESDFAKLLHQPSQDLAAVTFPRQNFLTCVVSGGVCGCAWLEAAGWNSYTGVPASGTDFLL